MLAWKHHGAWCMQPLLEYMLRKGRSRWHLAEAGAQGLVLAAGLVELRHIGAVLVIGLAVLIVEELQAARHLPASRSMHACITCLPD